MLKLIDEFGGEHEVGFSISKYRNNGSLAVRIVEYDRDCNYWEPWSNLTVNLSKNLGHNEVFIDVNNCGQEIRSFIMDNNLGIFTGEEEWSGFVAYPVCSLNMNEIRKYEVQ